MSMTILEFREKHLMLSSYNISVSELNNVFELDVAKRIYKEAISIVDKYKKQRFGVENIIINIPLEKIVYYWFQDTFICIDNYIETFRTDSFNLFYNIDLKIDYKNLLELYSIDNVLICLRYKSRAKKSDVIKLFVNKKIYLKIGETKKREYKLKKLLDSI